MIITTRHPEKLLKKLNLYHFFRTLVDLVSDLVQKGSRISAFFRQTLYKMGYFV